MYAGVQEAAAHDEATARSQSYAHQLVGAAAPQMPSSPAMRSFSRSCFVCAKKCHTVTGAADCGASRRRRLIFTSFLCIASSLLVFYLASRVFGCNHYGTPPPVCSVVSTHSQPFLLVVSTFACLLQACLLQKSIFTFEKASIVP